MKYTVVFSGEFKPDMNRAVILQSLAKLFKKDIDQISQLFNTKKVIIKKGLDEAGAKKYQQVLENAGAITFLQAEETPQPEQTARQNDHLSMAAAGEVIMAHDVPQTPDIDTSAFTMSEPGAVIATHEAVDAKEFNDLSFELMAPGSQLDEEEKAVPPEIDTSSMSMAEPGSNISNNK